MDEPMKLPPEIEQFLVDRAASHEGHHRMNAYRCPDCGRVLLTVDVNEGVTPMFLACRKTPGCRGMSVSSGYPDTPPPTSLGEPTHEWYRPSQQEFDAMEPAQQHHVLQGGLVLRERTS